MRTEYDFSKGTKNPYLDRSKVTVTLEVDEKTVEYFKKLSRETGCPYLALIESFLADCAARGLRPKATWQ